MPVAGGGGGAIPGPAGPAAAAAIRAARAVPHFSQNLAASLLGVPHCEQNITILLAKPTTLAASLFKGQLIRWDRPARFLIPQDDVSWERNLRNLSIQTAECGVGYLLAFKRTGRSLNEAELYEYAIGALGRKMRSVAELKRLLRGHCPDAASIERIIARLKDQKYLNDSSYAAAYSSFRRDNEKFGPRRVMTDLKVKGVHGDVIEKAIEETYAGVNEEDLARAFLKRKRLNKPANNKDAARIFRALIRAGFGPGISIKILRNWDVEDEVLTALEEDDAGTET